MSQVKVNKKALDAAVTKALKTVAVNLGNKFTESIEELAIVDTGAFRDSQTLEMVKPSLARYNWSVDYAFYLYAGYTTIGGTKIAGRNWVKGGFNKLNIAEALKAELAKAL